MNFQWVSRDSVEVEMREADESVENGRSLEYDHHDLELEVVFCPLEHPVEPLDEDRPLACPIPNSTILSAKDGVMVDEESVETPRKKRVETTATMEERRIVALEAPPAVRERHQTLPLEDDDQPSVPSKEKTPRPKCYLEGSELH